jgi:hypothetical protein
MFVSIGFQPINQVFRLFHPQKKTSGALHRPSERDKIAHLCSMTRLEPREKVYPGKSQKSVKPVERGENDLRGKKMSQDESDKKQ